MRNYRHRFIEVQGGDAPKHPSPLWAPVESHAEPSNAAFAHHLCGAVGFAVLALCFAGAWIMSGGGL